MKRAVITGGQGMLAGAMAFELRDAGWRVDAPGREELDVRDPEAVREFFAGRQIELLVCAAGVAVDRLLPRLDEAAWDEVWTTNYVGARVCAEAALPAFQARGSGHVVFISSRSAQHPPPGQVAYAAAKAALLGLTQDLARRHGPDGIRVNAILPGFLETKMTAAVSAVRRDEVLGDHALGRFNTVPAVAEFILHLHERLPHTSGQVFQLDSRC